MHRLLTLALAFHWTCVFALLGLVCGVEPRNGFAAPLRLLGLDTSGLVQDGGSAASALFAVAFLGAAALFLVCGAETLLTRDAAERRAGEGAAVDAGRSCQAFAFGAAVSALTLLLLAGALAPVAFLFSALDAMLAALLASFLVMRATVACEAAPRRTRAGVTLARRMALGAAHASLLSRVSGRARPAPSHPGPWRP